MRIDSVYSRIGFLCSLEAQAVGAGHPMKRLAEGVLPFVVVAAKDRESREHFGITGAILALRIQARSSF